MAKKKLELNIYQRYWYFMMLLGGVIAYVVVIAFSHITSDCVTGTNWSSLNQSERCTHTPMPTLSNEDYPSFYYRNLSYDCAFTNNILAHDVVLATSNVNLGCVGLGCPWLNETNTNVSSTGWVGSNLFKHAAVCIHS